jgi:hypothetical protein
MDFQSKTEKELLEELAALLFADKVFGPGNYTLTYPHQNDSVDVVIQSNSGPVSIQVVRVGMGDNHFLCAAQNTKKLANKDSSGWQLVDVDPNSQICREINRKTQKHYVDVDGLVLLILCDITLAAFAVVEQSTTQIQNVISDIALQNTMFKEIWIVRRVVDGENLIKLWPA